MKSINIEMSQIEEMIETFEFYAEGKNLEWVGCSCHGHYKRCEDGKKAEKCIEILNALKLRCNKCHSVLNKNGCCDDIGCDYYGREG